MNCEEFNARRFAYADGTLAAKERTEMELHLADCGACCRAARDEEKFARSLAGTFRQETAQLTLRPDIRREIRAAVEAMRAPTTTPQILFWRRFGWQTAAATALAAVIGGLEISHLVRPTGALPVALHEDGGQVTAVAIQSAYEKPIWKFSRDDNRVVDALVYETVAVSGSLYSAAPNSKP